MKKSVNNFNIIRDLLDFRSSDDFYFVQVLQRKKDFSDGQKVNGTNNNSRLVKAYYVKSLEHFDFIEKEVIGLCELFNARGGINLNRRSFKKMQLKHLQKITLQLIDGTHDKVHKAYNSVVGNFNDDSDKKWILDIDYPITDDRINNIPIGGGLEIKNVMFNYINSLNPIGDKIISEIPSKNGKHIITRPFNLHDFKKEFPNIDVHKNNPTNLYIP